MIWAQLRAGNVKLIVLSVVLVPMLIMPVLAIRLFVRAVAFGAGTVPHRLTFGADTLWYTGKAAPSSGSGDAELARRAIRAVSSEKRRRGLLIAAGATLVEIDPTLGGNNQNPSARVASQQRVTSNLLFTFSTDVSQPGSEMPQSQKQRRRPRPRTQMPKPPPIERRPGSN